MRINEITNESTIQELDLKKALGTAALATGIGLGGFGYNQFKNDTSTTPQVQQVKDTEQSSNLKTMPRNDLIQYIKDYSTKIGTQWQPNEFHQFLAQIFHETNNLRNMEENLNYSTPKVIFKTFTSTFKKSPGAIKHFVNNPRALANAVYANRLGNGDTTSGDGWKYRGRGLLHITGKENYERVGKGIGVDLVNNPDLLSTDPAVSVKAALWYWKNITGVKLAKAKQDFSNTKAVTATINPAGAGLKNRISQFKKISGKPTR